MVFHQSLSLPIETFSYADAAIPRLASSSALLLLFLPLLVHTLFLALQDNPGVAACLAMLS